MGTSMGTRGGRERELMTVKTQWAKPELIVLARGKAEEAVLSGCKIKAVGSIGPGASNQACNRVDNCGACQGHSGT